MSKMKSKKPNKLYEKLSNMLGYSYEENLFVFQS